MHALVESLGSQCYDAQNRERARWGSWNQPRSGTVTIDGYAHTFDGSYRGEVEFMKKWLSDRVDFMDTNFVGPVTYSIPGGFVSSGVAITITGPAGATIYYTTDDLQTASAQQRRTNIADCTGVYVSYCGHQ